MSTFMTLTRAEVSFDEREEVLINPQHITEVRVLTYQANELFPDRTFLSLRIQGGDGPSVLAMDSARRPLTPEEAAKIEPGELLFHFNQAVSEASTLRGAR